MKKLITFLFCTFFFFIGNSQVYEPFINFNRQWKYVQTLYVTTKSAQAMYLVSIGYFKGDSLINNIKYSKFYKKNIQPYDFDTIGNLAYFFNEDTLHKQVFVYDFQFDKTALLYDFNVKEGDSFNIYVLCDIYMKRTVTKVDTVFTLNKKLKRILFNDSTVWIEGIGCTTGSYIPSDGELICVKENNSVLYINNKYLDCDTIFRQDPYDKVKTLNKYKNDYEFYVFPNPVVSASVLKTNVNKNKKFKIEIYNYLGILVKVDSFIDNYPIGLINLNKGLYLYRIISNNKIIEANKIIVQ